MEGEINTHIQCNYSHFFLHGRILSHTGSSPKVKGCFHCSENESNSSGVAQMSIFVPCSTWKEQDLLDLIFTFSITLLSWLLNQEKIIFDAGLCSKYFSSISLWILLFLALLISASYQKLKKLYHYQSHKSIIFYYIYSAELPEPTVSELPHVSETTQPH